jgi:hypothetical protein
MGSPLLDIIKIGYDIFHENKRKEKKKNLKLLRI